MVSRINHPPTQALSPEMRAQPKLLDRIRIQTRRRHMSIRTEEA